MTTAPTVTLNDGHEMPAIGFGTAGLRDDEARASVATAIQVGWRMIDTAARYENEEPVGRAVRDADVPRDQLFVVSKVRGDDQGYDGTMRALDASLARLGLDYLDLYLIHWPLPRIDKYVDTWKAMIQQVADGRIRSIGVSNFLPEHLDRLITETGVAPAANQIELHPLLPQIEQRAADRERGIVTQAWSPLGRGRFLDDPVLREIADTHGRTSGQIVLRWNVQNGVVPMPRSANPTRIRENLDVFGFTLTDDEMLAIGTLDDGTRIFGSHPATHEEF